jgi:hypothetical protein
MKMSQEAGSAPADMRSLTSAPEAESADTPRIGDRAGEKVANTINSAVDTMLGAKERLVGGAQKTGELGASALALVGNFAGKVTDGVVDRLISAGQRLENNAIESGHKKQERTSLKAERKEDKVGVRAKIAGLKEIGLATQGMSKSEKAKFGLDLTELQKDARYKNADTRASNAADRGQSRMDERTARLGKNTAYNKAEPEATRAVQRQREAKMVADARAAEQSIRLNSKLTRAENRETRMQARADAKVARRARRQAWMNKALGKAGEVVDSAKNKAEQAAKLTAKAARGAGRAALTIISAPVVIGAAGAREVYDISRDIAGGIKDAAVRGAEKAGEAYGSARDTYHIKAGQRNEKKAYRAAGKATKHHGRSSSTAQETIVYTKHEGQL